MATTKTTSIDCLEPKTAADELNGLPGVRAKADLVNGEVVVRWSSDAAERRVYDWLIHNGWDSEDADFILSND